MYIELLIFISLSILSAVLGFTYFFYPKNSLSFFFILGLCVPTSNQFMKFTSFSGVYFYDFFFLFFTLYYLLTLYKYKLIFSKNILNLSLGIFLIVFYSVLAFYSSVNFDKYLLRDLRPFLTLLYAFVIISSFKKKIISINRFTNVLSLVFILKIVFFLAIYFGFNFSDQYYKDNIFRYFDATTFIACLFLIYSIFYKQKILENVSSLSFHFLIILCCLIVLISNLRILIFALILIFFLSSEINLFKKAFFIFSFITLFFTSSYFLNSERVLNASTSEAVAIQLATRFGPAYEKINEMKAHNYIYGLGLGTYFEIPWFKYRGLDSKLNTIDSTYLSLFVKYGIFSLLIIYIFFRLLLFNVNSSRLRTAYILFYLIIFFTLSSLYQSGTIFHFLFLNLFSLSVKDESASHSISVTSKYFRIKY